MRHWSVAKDHYVMENNMMWPKSKEHLEWELNNWIDILEFKKSELPTLISYDYLSDLEEGRIA